MYVVGLVIKDRKLLHFAEWSPLQEIDLASVPTDGREHDQTLYMEDSAWPYEGKLDEYLEAAHNHYAPSLEHRTERSLIVLLNSLYRGR